MKPTIAALQPAPEQIAAAQVLLPDSHGSWEPVDLSAVLGQDWKPPEPEVGRRADGGGLFYCGKTHTVAAETEAGKTWLALAVVRDEIEQGHHTVYIDFEDDEYSIVRRLLTIGLGPEQVRTRFSYVRPQNAIDGQDGMRLRQLVLERQARFVVIDGVTEAMTLHGLDLLNNQDVARFSALLPRMLANVGPAVVCLDHVVKSHEGRGRYALGGVHKLNGVDGAAYILENRVPFGIGRVGRSVVQVAKDRPGQLRRRGQPGNRGMTTYGELVLDSSGRDFAEVSVQPPAGAEPDDGRPVQVMHEVCNVLAGMPGGAQSKRQLKSAVRRRGETVGEAIDCLISEGYMSPRPAYKLLRAFDGETKEAPGG